MVPARVVSRGGGFHGVYKCAVSLDPHTAPGCPPLAASYRWRRQRGVLLAGRHRPATRTPRQPLQRLAGAQGVDGVGTGDGPRRGAQAAGGIRSRAAPVCEPVRRREECGRPTAGMGRLQATRRGSKYSGVPMAQSGMLAGTASKTRCRGTTLHGPSFGMTVATSMPCGSSLRRRL